jgi:hypothetical protein
MYELYKWLEIFLYQSSLAQRVLCTAVASYYEQQQESV